MTTCVICRRGPGEVKLGVKGFTSLLKVSAQRKDDLFASLGPEERSVHEHCRKSYTSSFNVLKAQKSRTDNFQPCVLRTVTSDGSEFEFKTHCIICTKKIDFEEIQKHKRRNSGVSHVEIVCSQKKSLLQETLLSICNERTDDKAADIKARIIVAGDIRAAEATYHRHCMQSFMSDHDRKRNNSSQESARDILDKTFKSWCEELPVMTEHGKQFTVQDLLDQFTSHLPPDMAPYSVKHFKRKLLQQLGSGITIAEVDGRPDIVTLTHHASSILYESYQDASETSAEQNIKTARYLGRTVKDLIKDVTSDSDKYPEPTDVNIDSLEHQIPKVRQEFMQNIFDKPRTASAILKQRILIASACHMLMQASHQSFTSLLLLSTGLFIHQTTRSRVALNLLSSLGVSVSYDQVMDFQKAAAVSQANSNTESTSRDVTRHGFSQWVADNFDHNVEDAVKIGLKIQENLTGKRFGDVVMKKADQVVTFSIMKKSVRLSDGEEIRMSSTELYQRLLAMTLVSGPPSTSVFSYENVKHRAWSNQPLCVVYDSYFKSTTKEPEQKRRKFMKVSCPDIVVSATPPVPQDKSSFMSNKHNKQALVDLIGNKLKEDGICVKHAADKGDADVVIVREALDMAETSAEVVVLADTDILVLLIHHIKPSTNIFMKTKKQLVSINQCKGGLGTELCHLPPFVHAMTGCDTTSAMFGIGKVKHLKLLQKSQQLRKIVSRFGDPASSKEIVIEAGEKFVSSLYSSTDDIYRLDDLRYLFAVSTKFTSVERMPPTSSACAFHSLRVHHQVSTWIHLKTVLDKHEHGFQTVNNTITPVITDKCGAPANLLKEIRCSCSAGSQL